MLVTKDRIMTGTEARSFLGDIQAKSRAAAAARGRDRACAPPVETGHGLGRDPACGGAVEWLPCGRCRVRDGRGAHDSQGRDARQRMVAEAAAGFDADRELARCGFYTTKHWRWVPPWVEREEA